MIVVSLLDELLCRRDEALKDAEQAEMSSALQAKPVEKPSDVGAGRVTDPSQTNG